MGPLRSAELEWNRLHMGQGPWVQWIQGRRALGPVDQGSRTIQFPDENVCGVPLSVAGAYFLDHQLSRHSRHCCKHPDIPPNTRHGCGHHIYRILDVTRAYPCTEAGRAVAGENRAKRHRDQHLRTVTLSSDTGPAILNATVALKQA